MKSVGVRIAFWYALASLLTLGSFFRIGRHLVEQHIVRSLDTGIAAEFEQLKRRVGSNPGLGTLKRFARPLRRNASPLNNG